MSLPLRQEFEDEGDWIEKFIQAVQSKPPIYNKNLPEHSDRNRISRLWDEICETMVPMWNDMSALEKSGKGKDLRNKWRNLKTCFRRELQKQTKPKSGQTTSKRRKYVYFDQLLFLLPTMEDRPTVSECGPSESGTQDDQYTLESEEGEFQEDTCETESSTQKQKLKRMPEPVANRPKKVKRPIYEESVLSIVKQKKEEPIDEDQFFLLSLVPSFKKLSDVQKIEVKIKFLSTLKRFTRPYGTESSFDPLLQIKEENSSYRIPLNYLGYYPQQNSLHSFNFHQNTVNYPSASSTPNQTLSDVSQTSSGSNINPLSPQEDLTL